MEFRVTRDLETLPVKRKGFKVRSGLKVKRLIKYIVLVLSGDHPHQNVCQ